MNLKKWLCGILAAGAVLACLTGCQKEQDRQTEPANTVSPSTADPRETLDPAAKDMMDNWDAPETDAIQWNPYGTEDFAYDGDYLTCLSGQSLLGVDVSFWQGDDIDWEQVASAGVEFVMIRLGGRGTTEGGLYEDDCARINYEGAHAAGLKVGGYFFSQATSEAEAVEEAQFALDMIRDWEVDMPIVFDWEYMGADARTANTDSETTTACAAAFCDTVKAAGYTPMIYFNPEQGWMNMDLEELTDYQYWLAWYNEEMYYPYKVDMWQYSCTGTVPGIYGDVDMNLYLLYENA